MPAVFNPHDPDFSEFDAETRRVFEATIEFFETRGKRVLKEQDRENIWYADFLDFVKRERVFATLLTPAAEADGDPDKRWDTGRVAMYSHILGFYGMAYWYVWQVTILGLGPIWQSSNAKAKAKAAALLDSGAIFAFGLSERDHGADVYTTDMVLTADEAAPGSYRANGGKYYIGNGNLAGMVSVFGRIAGLPADAKNPEGYVFFAVDSQHKNYKLKKNVVDAQMYVAAFELENYPVKAEDILHTGQAAFDAAINTVNVGKFNLGFGAIGLTEHAFYEAITHAENRVLFGQRVTEFAQVRAMVTETYARLTAMQLYSERAIDYMRSASSDDRRYLLFNAIEKMTVTRQGESAIRLLWDVISAKAFENDMYFPMAALSVSGLPRLEGTVHVNMALALKFLPGYLFNPTDPSLALLSLRRPDKPSRIPDAAFRPVFTSTRRGLKAAAPLLARAGVVGKQSGLGLPDRRRDATDDVFLFNQGPASNLGKVSFHNWRETFEQFTHIPNVRLFVEQIDGLQALLGTAPLTKSQRRDLDFLLTVGDMFTLVPYAELILQQAGIEGTDATLIDQIFDVLVRDFSIHALTLTQKPSASSTQQAAALACIRRPAPDAERFEAVFQQVRALANTYEMSP